MRTYQYTLQADDLDRAAPLGRRGSQRALRRVPELADVNSDQQDRGLQTTLVIDRDDRRAPGHHARAMIDPTLNDAFGQRAGLDHLHRAQPVPRGDGGGAALLAEPRRR